MPHAVLQSCIPCLPQLTGPRPGGSPIRPLPACVYMTCAFALPPSMEEKGHSCNGSWPKGCEADAVLPPAGDGQHRVRGTNHGHSKFVRPCCDVHVIMQTSNDTVHALCPPCNANNMRCPPGNRPTDRPLIRRRRRSQLLLCTSDDGASPYNHVSQMGTRHRQARPRKSKTKSPPSQYVTSPPRGLLQQRHL